MIGFRVAMRQAKAPDVYAEADGFDGPALGTQANLQGRQLAQLAAAALLSTAAPAGAVDRAGLDAGPKPGGIRGRIACSRARSPGSRPPAEPAWETAASLLPATALVAAGGETDMDRSVEECI